MRLCDVKSRPRTVRGAWGALLLVEPRFLLSLGGGADSRGVRQATRVLGARHLIEALILTRDPRLVAWVRTVDAVHALSMLTLAAISPRLRRDALLSAASATGLVVLSAREGSAPGPRG